MKDVKVYKGILVAKGTTLYDALETVAKCKPNTVEAKAAQESLKKVFSEAEERFNKMYSEEDRNWFFSWRKHMSRVIQPVIEEVVQ